MNIIYIFARETSMHQGSVYRCRRNFYSTGPLQPLLQFWHKQIWLLFDTTFKELQRWSESQTYQNRMCTDVSKPFRIRGRPSTILFCTTSPMHRWRDRMRLTVLSLTPVSFRIFLYLYPRTTASRNAIFLISIEMCRLMRDGFQGGISYRWSLSILAGTERLGYHHWWDQTKGINKRFSKGPIVLQIAVTPAPKPSPSIKKLPNAIKSCKRHQNWANVIKSDQLCTALTNFT